MFVSLSLSLTLSHSLTLSLSLSLTLLLSLSLSFSLLLSDLSLSPLTSPFHSPSPSCPRTMRSHLPPCPALSRFTWLCAVVSDSVVYPQRLLLGKVQPRTCVCVLRGLNIARLSDSQLHRRQQAPIFNCPPAGRLRLANRAAHTTSTWRPVKPPTNCPRVRCRLHFFLYTLLHSLSHTHSLSSCLTQLQGPQATLGNAVPPLFMSG